MVTIVAGNRGLSNDYFQSFLPAVNSPSVAHRESVPTTTSYRPCNDGYSQLQRTRLDNHTLQDKESERCKKEKKWSLGKLFRRKKKEDESASSSESDEAANNRSPSKKKTKKKKKATAVAGNFDHIVMRETRRAHSLMKQSNREFADDGVLSDPSAGFINYRSKISQEPFQTSKDSMNIKLNSDDLNGREVAPRMTRKGRLKARVEALRNSMRVESSSEEDSIKSSNSSSMIRFRSEESLMRSRDSSLNKKSRSARNERYIKRLSRDEENQLNKEAELLQQGYTKAEVEMLTRTPTSQSSGYGTCKRDSLSTKYKNDQTHAIDVNRRPLKSDSISSFPSTQSYISSINFNAKINKEHNNYSMPYHNNITRDATHSNNNNRDQSIIDVHENGDVMCVKFPLGNVSNIKRDDRAPPVPPPRDMHRKVSTPISMYYENNPIVADRMEHNRNVVHGVPNNDFERVMRRSQERSLQPVINGLRRPISTSEDHIAMQNNEHLNNFYLHKGEQPRRPASVSAEPNHHTLYSTPPWRQKLDKPSSIIKPEPVQLRNDFLYYADHSPRSRRPISIQSSQNNIEGQYLSDSTASLHISQNGYGKPKTASEFWKKLDDAERYRNQQMSYANSRSVSEGSNAHNYKQTMDQKQLINNEYKRIGDMHNKSKLNLHTQPRDTIDDAKMWKATTEYKSSPAAESPKSVTSPIAKTHVRHKSDTFISNYHIPSDDEKNTERRKSTNLDDALNELEAIYNSLGLGDEDLLDRAERREAMTSKHNDHFNDWNGNTHSQPHTPLRRIQRRSTLPDKLQDDMAFRRMNTKDKPDFKDSQPQISYMLASPVFVPYTSDDDRHSEHDKNEPDIVYDDVVYRNIKQSKNHLKSIDPQPPFGIPLGPVTPAPQSDYLHATPENKHRSRFIPSRSPDLVSDDLAYRSLRKDNRHSSLFNREELNTHLNNNHNYNETLQSKDSTANMKKKRAVRSLSANIFTMIQKEIDDALNMSNSPLQKTNSNADVNWRLRDSVKNKDHNMDYYPRQKVKQRHNTVNLFVNSSPHHFAKDDSCIHSDNKYLAKPPSCDKSKSSSPSSHSPQASKRSSKDEFQQVLSMLAQEAMDTSNKLGVALAELDKKKNICNKSSDIQTKLSDSRMTFLNGLTNKYGIDSEKLVKVHSEIVDLKGDDSVLNEKPNSKAKRTEDSLLAISDQLYKVEDQIKHSHEKEISFEDDNTKVSRYNLKPEEKKARESTVMICTENKIIPDVVPVTLRNDVVQIKNAKLPNEDKPTLISNKVKCQMKDPIKTNAFKELKDGITDLIAGISHVNDKLFTVNMGDNETEKDGTDKVQVTSIAEATKKLNEVTQNIQKENTVNRASVNLSIYEDNLEVKKEPTDSTEYNSSEELASIFNLDKSNGQRVPLTSNNNKEISETVRSDLNSPKLVQSINQQLRRLSIDNSENNLPSQSNSLSTNIVPWRTKRQNLSHKDKSGDDNTESKSSWHESPSTLMLACSYTLICSQHFADLDWLTILGLILAVVTIIAMLLI